MSDTYEIEIGDLKEALEIAEKEALSLRRMIKEIAMSNEAICTKCIIYIEDKECYQGRYCDGDLCSSFVAKHYAKKIGEL